MNKISKVLEGIIAQTAFDTAKAGVGSSFKDYLGLAILRHEGSLAQRLLQRRMADWQIYQAVLRIENQLHSSSDDGLSAEEFFRSYTADLTSRYGQGRSISTLHALVDILADSTTVCSKVFALYGITAADIEQDILQGVKAMDGDDSADAMSSIYTSDSEPVAEHKPSQLEQFGVDVTRLAREGKIDPVVGRECEIERVIHLLSRRKKNNPVLVGEAGVGKSAIVEGLALRIVQGDVPYNLMQKRILSLDVSALVAGTKFRGEFEERMQQLLVTLREAKDVIVFIDEIHTIVGAGSTQGALDTANILKPALARGDFQTIGATTIAEYRQHIERDAALERRFQRVMVEPTTAEQTLTILRGAAPIYEAHHRVVYTEQAIEACVELAERYISERHFPDKAIDLLDEAGAKAHISSAARPENIVAMERAIASATAEREQAVQQSEYNRAIELRLKELALKHNLKLSLEQWDEQLKANPVVVDREDVARVVTQITGVPASRINSEQGQLLSALEARLAERVVGQKEAVQSVARAIRRSRAGLKSENRPAGVFLFVGSTGVGKTLLAKELAVWLGGSGDSLIRLDMSEYSQQHNVARLFGAPPGYVGYGEGGQLTEAVRRRPYSVVLLDEIEKAHKEVFNAMLQIFDEGTLTDGEGRKVDFRNTIIIMTSNLSLAAAARVGYATAADVAAYPKSDYRKALESNFSPEFINRVDEIVAFNNLTSEDAKHIVALQVASLVSRLKTLGYDLQLTPAALNHIVEVGFDSRYGARSLSRTVQTLVEEPLADMIVADQLSPNQPITVDYSNGRVTIG